MRDRYERAIGEKYKETQKMTLAEIAKLIRNEIKLAKISGQLPGDLVSSVRSRSGIAIDIDWIVSKTPVFEPGRYGFQLNDEGERIQQVLKQIHGAYNFDGSEVESDYFDVRFYGSPSVEWKFANCPDPKLVTNTGYDEIDIEMLVTLVRDGRFYQEAMETTKAMMRIDK